MSLDSTYIPFIGPFLAVVKENPRTFKESAHLIRKQSEKIYGDLSRVVSSDDYGTCTKVLTVSLGALNMASTIAQSGVYPLASSSCKLIFCAKFENPFKSPSKKILTKVTQGALYGTTRCIKSYITTAKLVGTVTLSSGVFSYRVFKNPRDTIRKVQEAARILPQLQSKNLSKKTLLCTLKVVQIFGEFSAREFERFDEDHLGVIAEYATYYFSHKMTQKALESAVKKIYALLSSTAKNIPTPPPSTAKNIPTPLSKENPSSSSPYELFGYSNVASKIASLRDSISELKTMSSKIREITDLTNNFLKKCSSSSTLLSQETRALFRSLRTKIRSTLKEYPQSNFSSLLKNLVKDSQVNDHFLRLFSSADSHLHKLKEIVFFQSSIKHLPKKLKNNLSYHTSQLKFFSNTLNDLPDSLTDLEGDLLKEIGELKYCLANITSISNKSQSTKDFLADITSISNKSQSTRDFIEDLKNFLEALKISVLVTSAATSLNSNRKKQKTQNPSTSPPQESVNDASLPEPVFTNPQPPTSITKRHSFLQNEKEKLPSQTNRTHFLENFNPTAPSREKNASHTATTPLSPDKKRIKTERKIKNLQKRYNSRESRVEKARIYSKMHALQKTLKT